MIQGFIFKFQWLSVSILQPMVGRTSIKAVLCNCYTECVIYENEPSQLAWMVNSEMPVSHSEASTDIPFVSCDWQSELWQQCKEVVSMCFNFWYSLILFLSDMIYGGWLWMYIIIFFVTVSFDVFWMHCIIIVTRLNLYKLLSVDACRIQKCTS